MCIGAFAILAGLVVAFWLGRRGRDWQPLTYGTYEPRKFAEHIAARAKGKKRK
jgi:hypothetical protein